METEVKLTWTIQCVLKNVSIIVYQLIFKHLIDSGWMFSLQSRWTWARAPPRHKAEQETFRVWPVLAVWGDRRCLSKKIPGQKVKDYGKNPNRAQHCLGNTWKTKITIIYMIHHGRGLTSCVAMLLAWITLYLSFKIQNGNNNDSIGCIPSKDQRAKEYKGIRIEVFQGLL